MKYRANIQPSQYPDAQVGNNIELSEELGHRFFKVLRLREGQEVGIFDGQGRQIEGKLGSHKEKSLQISQIVKVDREPILGLAQAWVSMDKAEQIIQRCTEIGATHIIFFHSDRGEAKSKGDISKKLARLKRISVDAARQSGRLWVPQIEGPMELEEVLCKADPENVRNWMGVVSPWSGGDPSNLEINSRLHGNDRNGDLGNFIWIGPEGGLSPRETGVLSVAGVQEPCWNPNILRTETAGMAALAIIQGDGFPSSRE